MTGVPVRLVRPDHAVLEAALRGRADLERALGCAVADGWAVFAGALEHARDLLAADPGSVRWGPRLFVVDEPRTLVGWGGFKGPPRGGVVELGYAVAPAWEGRGVGTAATQELLREAFAAPAVQVVIAHTLAAPGASVRVLEKTGFVRAGEQRDGRLGDVWRFRLGRDEFSRRARS